MARSTSRTALVWATMLAAVMSIGGCAVVDQTAGPPPGPAVAATVNVPRPDHIVVVVLENKKRSTVIGSTSAPYLTALAKAGANMSESYGVAHPSQPNYLALFSGSQQGVFSDSCPQNVGAAPNLGRQLLDAGLSFVGYSESMPKVGYTGCASGRYQRKHNPWVDFGNLPAAVNQPFTAFPSNYASLPTVAFVTPNMCNDMHDCSVGTGDTWMKQNLDRYAQWAQSHNSLLVVTFDENSGGTVNQIPTLIVGEHIRPGIYAETMNHYTLLRTVEAAYGLAPLGRAAQSSPLITIWSNVPAIPTDPTGIINPSFESHLAGWALSGATRSTRSKRHGGSLAARAGSTRATLGDSVISQTFIAPSTKTKISVGWLGHCHDKSSHAWATVILRRNTSHKMTTLLPRTCIKKGHWKKVSTKLTAGHSYTLSLVNHDDGKPKTPNRTYFDDVTFR